MLYITKHFGLIGTIGPIEIITILLVILSIVGMCFNILIPQFTYNGIWGIPHLFFALGVTGLFYLGSKLDSRYSPPPRDDDTNSTCGLRVMTILRFIFNIVILHILPYLQYQRDYTKWFVVLFVAIVFVTRVYEVILFYKHECSHDSLPGTRKFATVQMVQKVQTVLFCMEIVYTVVCFSYAVSILTQLDDTFTHITLYSIYLFHYIIPVIFASLICGICRAEIK